MAALSVFSILPITDGESHWVEIPMRGFENLKLQVENPGILELSYLVLAKVHPDATLWATLQSGTVASGTAKVVEVNSHYAVVRLQLTGNPQVLPMWVSLSGILEN